MSSNNLILSVTKIGDLFLRNTITESKNGPIPNVKLDIPDYQRPYKWTAKNVNQLLDDIEEARKNNKEVYRVGTLILHKREDKYDIVDGQQRSITFSLLLRCLGYSDNEISLCGKKLTDNSYNIRNIINNYDTLARRIDKYGNSSHEDKRNLEKEDFKEYITNNCEMIVIITEDINEAFQFFDSQNARGKELYPHDLLKAYHLREMNEETTEEIEKTVKIWEELNQLDLADLFQNYLYRIKEWINGNPAYELNEKNIDLFKGVSARDNYPYAQYYKSAYAYADSFNKSMTPFVTGMHKISPFQLDTPIVAGKPFFEYTKHYFDILADIQNNDKYEGYFVNDNDIIKTLNLIHYKNGTGNKVTRMMLDTAILLYVDRFCPDKPSKKDIDYLDQFIVYAFIWAYSMRAQYVKVGWSVAQNYIMGTSGKNNSFNIYKMIVNSQSPSVLFSLLSNQMLPINNIADGADSQWNEVVDGVAQNYLYFFNKYKFWEGR